MLLGIILIICGILIAAYPPLLSLVIATLFISAGVVTLMAGYRYKKMSKKSEDPFIDFFMRT